jgi:hypothetical protein
VNHGYWRSLKNNIDATHSAPVRTASMLAGKIAEFRIVKTRLARVNEHACGESATSESRDFMAR